MRKTKIIGIIMILMLLLAAAGCGNSGSGAQTETIPNPAEIEQAAVGESSQQDAADESAEETAEAEKILKFRDVYGVEYETEIDPDAPANPFDPSLFRHEGEFVYYDDPSLDTSLGVDVSAYQGYIDWPTVKAQGIDFAIVRLGFRGYGEEGTLVEDEMALQNIYAAKEAGLLTGAYFFSQAITEEEAVEEAEFVLNLLGGMDMELPIVYDVEHIKDDTARTDDIEGEQFTKNAKAFCKRITDAGYDAMIYSNMLWEAFEFDMAELSVYPFWYADYEEVPQTPYLFEFWQYTEEGYVEGVEGPVDIDLRIKK